MIGVYGLGNVLLCDDGFGPSAVRRLESQYVFPEGAVALRDLGTPGLDLASHLLDLEELVFLDTLSLDEEPGTVHVLGKADLLREDVKGLRQSTHEAGLREAILTADLVGRGPAEIRFFGVVPECLESGAGLSPCVERAIEPVVALTLDALARKGVVPARRRAAQPTGAWWEGVGVRQRTQVQPVP